MQNQDDSKSVGTEGGRAQLQAGNKAEEWIDALQAVYFLSIHLGGDDRAKSQIVSRLQDGTLTCRADSWYQDADVGEVCVEDLEFREYKNTNPHKGQYDKTVSKIADRRAPYNYIDDSFFSIADGWIIDESSIVWSQSYFIARKKALIRSKYRVDESSASLPYIRRFVFGLEFRSDEILSMLPSESANTEEYRAAGQDGEQGGDQARHDASKQPSNAGRKPSLQWEDWVAELVLLQHEGGILVTSTPDKIINQVATRLAKRELSGPSRSRTYPVARKVLEILRNRGNLI